MTLGSNATRWYSTREAVKALLGISGTREDALIDRELMAASADIEMMLGRQFIPETAIKYFRWPDPRYPVYGRILKFRGQDLLAATLVTSAGTTIASGDYFLEPVNSGPPYDRIEIDESSSLSWSIGDTPQRSIAITGRWGFTEQTKAAGTLRSGAGINSSVTTMLVSDGSLIGVGDTCLIGTEQVFVSGKTNAAEENADLLNGALTADTSETSVTVDSGSRYNAGEMIQVESERMLVRSISGNVLTVDRAYDGTVIAAHANDTAVHVFRTLTIVRGVNGTTAASAALAAAISVFVPPADVRQLCEAMAEASLRQGQSGWTGQISGGEAAIETKMTALYYLRERVKAKYRALAVG